MLRNFTRFCMQAEPKLLKTQIPQKSLKHSASIIHEKQFNDRFHDLRRNSKYQICNEKSISQIFTYGSKCIAPFTPQYNKRGKLKFVIQFPRQYSTNSQDGDKSGQPKMRVPKLILIQNPFTWLVTKFDFTVLRSVWDPTFQEKEFKIGTKQAVSRVTKLLSEGRYADLSGLLTRSAKAALLRDLERTWPERQRKLIALSNDDIQITSPRKVYFIRVAAEKKFCAVDMAFLALKWASVHRADGLVFAEIFARFHRDYTASSIPEWTIAYFKVTRFDIMRKK